MLVKFLARGTGSARAAARYLLGERDAAGKLREGVEVLRGNPDMVAAVADSVSEKTISDCYNITYTTIGQAITSLRIPLPERESNRRHRRSLDPPDGFRAIRASHGVRAVETAWALVRGNVRCSSRWVGPPSVWGWEGNSTRREGRTESVPEAGGDRHRSGGNADPAARRSRRGLSRETGGLYRR